MSFFKKRRKNTTCSPEKSLAKSQKHNGLVHLDTENYLTAGLFYRGDIDIDTYINMCMCATHMGSTPGVVKGVFYRARERTKIHLIYPLKWRGEELLQLTIPNGQG